MGEMTIDTRTTRELVGSLFGPEATDSRRRAWLATHGAALRRDDVTRPVVFVGTATCGLGAGAGQTLEVARAWLDDAGVDADVVEVGCIGICCEEPIMDVQLPGRARLSFGKVTPDRVADVLQGVLSGSPPDQLILGQMVVNEITAWPGVPRLWEHPFFEHQTRRVLANCGLADPSSLEEYLARGGFRALAETIHRLTPAQVCDVVEASGLRGRGGGGFPTGRKWRFALQTPAEQKFLVCNADEGDPGAFMDRAVIEGDPYRLVEGLALAAYGIGATKAYVYIRAEYPLAVARLRHAIEQAYDAGLLGHDVLGSGMELDVLIKTGAGAFVCGEETALIHSVEGKRGMPRPRPPYPAIEGLFGFPTVINNVETLANLPDILPDRAERFAALGTEGSKGTKVFALSGKVARTGLVEVRMGTTLREIVFDIGGGVPGGRRFKAVQIGGPSGGCVPEERLDIEVDYESLGSVGAMMGSGGLVVLDQDTCMVDVALFFMDFIQRESCGKCIPCREGTRQMLEVLESITRSRGAEAPEQALERMRGLMQLEELAKVIKDSALCGLGQTAANPVLSTLRWFREEYEAHVFERRCPAGVCKGLRRFEIDPDRCTGCTLCARKCPAGAIMGTRRSPHYIVPDKCIACGQCLEVCRFDAISVS